MECVGKPPDHTALIDIVPSVVCISLFMCEGPSGIRCCRATTHSRRIDCSSDDWATMPFAWEGSFCPGLLQIQFRVDHQQNDFLLRFQQQCLCLGNVKVNEPFGDGRLRGSGHPPLEPFASVFHSCNFFSPSPVVPLYATAAPQTAPSQVRCLQMWVCTLVCVHIRWFGGGPSPQTPGYIISSGCLFPSWKVRAPD